MKRIILISIVAFTLGGVAAATTDNKREVCRKTNAQTVVHNPHCQTPSPTATPEATPEPTPEATPTPTVEATPTATPQTVVLPKTLPSVGADGK